MIERCIQPGRGRMAHGAILRESAGHVIRNPRHRRCLVVIRCMAAVTSGRQRTVVVIRVAGSARHAHVRAGQWEARGVVIEIRVKPSDGSVAHRAVLREIGSHVIGDSRDVRRIVVIRRMAAVARRRRIRVVPASVALRAQQVGVPVSQWEKLRVIEIGRVPP